MADIQGGGGGGGEGRDVNQLGHCVSIWNCGIVDL